MLLVPLMGDIFNYMWIFIILIIWWLIGCLLYGKALFNASGLFTVADLCVTLLAGLVGPFMIFLYIDSVASNNENSFWNKRIF